MAMVAGQTEMAAALGEVEAAGVWAVYGPPNVRFPAGLCSPEDC